MKNKKNLLFCLFFAPLFSFAQGVAYPLSNEAVYHTMDRFEILHGNPGYIYSAQKTFTRGDVTRYAQYLDTTANVHLSDLDKKDIQYIYNDNNDWLVQSGEATTLAGKKEPLVGQLTPPQYQQNRKPLLKTFYKTPANFWEVNAKNFSLRINPILNIKAAQDTKDEELIFTNLRGNPIGRIIW